MSDFPVPEGYKHVLFIDFETYGTKDLTKVGAYAYTEDPEFLALITAWALDDAPVRAEVEANHIPQDLVDLITNPDVLKVAHNAEFDRLVASRPILGPGCTYLSPAHWMDTAAIAAGRALPRGLDGLGKALGTTPKDSGGTALINHFSKPNRKGERNLPEDHPDKWLDFIGYAIQDVETLREIWLKLQDYETPTEREVYILDQIINGRGLRVDLDLARLAYEAAQDNAERGAAALKELTGLENPGSNVQMLQWLRGQGFDVANTQKATIDALAAREDLTSLQREVLALRQDTAGVAAKKYDAALRSASSDGRLRGQFRYHGAHTGRWSGRGVQFQNLPRARFDKADDAHNDTLRDSAILDLQLGAGADPDTLKALIRSIFIGGPSTPLTVVDYSAIEARVVAWLAGEEWALQAFRDNRDIYVETAARLGPRFTRQDGKTASLALGYNGGVQSMRVMGADGSDAHLQDIVDLWREANPSIVALWRTLGTAFLRGGRVGEFLEVVKDGRDRHIVLPSGRSITYPGVRVRHVETKFGTREQPHFIDWAKNGVLTSTYGGKLTENVTQAVARDVLAQAMLDLDKSGFRIVGHVHDEVVIEGDVLAEVSAAMSKAPSWAPGLPLSAVGYSASRYKKD